jgi:hypothetical protein
MLTRSLPRSVSYLLRQSVASFTIADGQRDVLEPLVGSLDAPDYISAGACKRFLLDGVFQLSVPVYISVR